MARSRGTQGPGPWCGTYGGYTNHGCKCRPCTDANTVEVRRQRAERAARLAAGEVTVPHGRDSTYTNWGCHCRECTAAHTATRNADRRGRRTREDPS